MDATQPAVRVGFSLLTLFPGRVGGSETYVRGLLDALGAAPGDVRLTVLANRHVMSVYRSRVPAPHALHHVRSYRPGNGVASRALAMATAAVLPGWVARDLPRDLDLIHYPMTLPIPRADAVPMVVTLHDAQRQTLSDISRLASAYRRLAYEQPARSADVVIVLSEYFRSRLIEGLGLSADRVEVVHQGVDPQFTVAPDGSNDRLVGRLPERFVIYPANLWPHKNHRRLLRALAAADDRELHLVLAGQTYGRDNRLVADARRLRIASRVHHLGHVPPDAMPALYRRARALVFPSLAEGFGTPPLEAMACGCPVASSTAGALPEVCGDAVLPFDPHDVDAIRAAIDRIVADEALRADLRAKGIANAAAFTWSAAAERHRAIYGRLARGESGAVA